MTIISSTIIENSPQADGRHWIREKHIDDLGHEYFFQYLAEADLDVNAILTLHANELVEASNG